MRYLLLSMADEFHDAMETTNKSNKRTLNVSPRSKFAEEQTMKRKKLLEQLETLNVQLVNNDTAIPDYAKTIISQLSGLLSVASTLLSQPSPIEEIEEYQRQHEVVIAMLPESHAETAIKRVQEDRAEVFAMLDHADIEFLPSNCYRMGKKGKKPRLLKVVMPTREAARSFVKAANKIRQKFPVVKIRPSLSKADRETHRNLIIECTKRRQATNQDYIIYAGQIILRSEIRKAN